MSPCPPPEELSSLLSGKLGPDAAAAIENHVETCEHCQETLHTFGQGSDWLAEGIRAAAQHSQASLEPDCAAAVSHIQQFVHKPSDVTTDLAAENALGGPTINAEASTADLLGTIREYKLLAKLGEGGMGAVYKALHTKLRRVVALKLLPAAVPNSPAIIARFEREMQAVGALDHPNIVRAFDAGESDGRHYLVMEYVKGRDLSQISRDVGLLPVADACELVRQAAIGLQHVFEAGLVHRDIKPSNLMLTEMGGVKILDLGLALLNEADHAGELTSTGQVMGTLDYMAPEQGGDTHNVDIRADIYSLGATLYKLLTGVAPFGDRRYDTPVKKLMALATQEPAPLRERRSDVPQELASIVERMLAKSPTNRYAAPAHVAGALAPFAEGANLPALLSHLPNEDSSHAVETPSTHRTVSLATQPAVQAEPTTQPSARRNSLAPLGIGVGLVLFVLLAAVMFYVPTRHGLVKVTINDPSITVKFGSTGATVLGADEKPIDLKFGDQKIEIKRGDFEFATTHFKLEKQGITTLDVEFRPGELKVLYDGKVIERKSLGTDSPPSSQAAKALKAGARYVLQFDDRTDSVDLSDVTYDGTYDLTIEGWFQTLEAGHCEFLRFEPDGPILFAMVKDGERNIAAEWTSAEGKQVYAVCINRLKVGEVQHVALVYRRERMLVFVDGVPVAESEVKIESGRNRKLKLGNALMNLHALRVSRGIRYAQPFQPEKSLVADADTLVNYRCDEGTDDRLNDTSGRKLHGVLDGPKWVRLEAPRD